MITLLAFLAAAQAPGAAPAQAPPVVQPLRPTDFSAEPVAVLIAGFDADRDARVTRAELEAGIAASFGGAGDFMSPIDFSNWAVRWLGHQGALPGRFDFDQDEDDRVSRAEYAAGLTRNFDRLDADKDGVLVRAELVTIHIRSQPPLPRPRRGRN